MHIYFSLIVTNNLLSDFFSREIIKKCFQWCVTCNLNVLCNSKKTEGTFNLKVTDRNRVESVFKKVLKKKKGKKLKKRKENGCHAQW